MANPLTPALAGGSGLSASVGSVADAVIIAGVLGLNALIGGAQRLGTNRALRALRTTSTGQIRRLLEAAAVEVDESSLTGESALVPAL